MADLDCQGAMTLGDVSIPTLERLGLNPAQFPLDVVLPGASVDFGSDTQGIKLAEQGNRTLQFRGEPVETTAYRMSFQVSATALSQSCEVSARFGADNGSTTECSACEYPGFEDRVRDDDGLFVTVTVVSLCGNGSFDAGEECDQGTSNGVDGSCCDRFCRLAPATVICRPSAADCDEDETCTGQSAICPEDLPKPEGSPCTADRSPCTDDVCGAGGVCEHPPSAGATCADGLCTCDNDGLFCNGLVQCGASLCIVLPPPCGEDDTCDEDRNICISPFGTATPTATPSADTPSPTAVTPGAATPTATAVAAICAGDCNGDRQVVVNELVLGVNVALGNQPASACAAFDSNRDGSVVINELVAGVSSALSGCRP